MTTRTKFSRRTVLLAFAALALIVVPAAALLLRQSKTPRVTATFLSLADTLRPQLAQFAITNHSSRLVHFMGYQFETNRLGSVNDLGRFKTKSVPIP